MKKKFSQHIKRGLPGGANQLNKFTKGVVSTEGYRSNSPDKDNSVNVINSSSITMTETDGRPLKKGPLFGMDNLGNKQLMMPGFNYQFPGSQVAEMPIDNLREQLNPVRPASIPRPHPWGFIQAQNNIVGGVGVNFPKGLGFNATGVLPVSPDPVFKGVGSLGINQQFGDLNIGASIGTPVLRDYDTKKLKFDPEISLSGRYTIPYTDKKKLSRPLLKEGGYMEAELTDEEIEEYQKGGYIVEELPIAQKGVKTDEELLRHQIGKIMDYEYNRGSKSGRGLPNYGNDRLKSGATREDAINWAMENIGPDLIYYQTPLEKGEAADFIYNAGKDPRAYAIQEYYRKYDKNQLKNNNWPGRKGSDFTDTYKSTIGKLPENERRILMNKGRDWYYQNILRDKGSINEDLKAYKATWYGRIHNTNDLEDYIPDNPKFKYPYKRGGYIIEELPNKKGECIGCLDKKQKGDAGMPECPDGAKYDFKRKSCVCSGKTRWDGTQCVQDVAETTVYKKQESRRKQLKLMDRLKLLKQAYKQFHNKGGFGNLILDVDDKTDKIPKLKQLVQLYEKELKDVERQHAPAFTALKQLKENNPEKYKNFKLKDIYDPQTFEELRGLYKEGKLGDDSGQNDMLFRYFNNTLGKGVDLNIAEGRGPNATYSAKDTEDNWMHDAQGFTDMVGTGVNALMMGAATLPLGGSGAALGRLLSPVTRGAGAVLKNPWVQRAITGYGLTQVPRYAEGAYDAYKKDDWGGVGENVAGAAISLAPGAIFKNTGKVITGTGKTLAKAFGKEAGAATKYAGNLISSPLRRIPGYNKVVNISTANKSVPGLPNLKYNLKFLDDAVGAGAPVPTFNPITGAKNVLGATYTAGKALALPTTALAVGSTIGQGSNLSLDQVGTAASKSLDIVNPISKLKGLSVLSNNPLVEKYGLAGLHWLGREGKDIYKGVTKQLQGETDAALVKYLQALAGSKNTAEYLLKNNKEAVTDYVHDVRLHPKNIFNPITKPINKFLNPLNNPFNFDNPLQYPVIKTDPDGIIIDSDIQTTEQLNVDRPKKIIMADNYKSDTPQMKGSKTKSKTLKEGGVIETMLTQKEIDMLRMGGYVVEEI